MDYCIARLTVVSSLTCCCLSDVVQMFEMDAFVGVDVLGLQFMKGDQPHAGFPEAAYHLMAEQLARAGYRVVVVEQVCAVLVSMILLCLA